jgi:hypothetical protein
MPYPERIRNYWLRVAGDKCQAEIYTEQHGFRNCGKRAEHVHHIIAEGWTYDHGGNPDENTGLPVCKHHHMNFVERTDEPIPFTRDFSFHPDMGRAFEQYKGFKERRRFLGKHASQDDDPFRAAVLDHRDKSRRGEHYWVDDGDEYYIQKMEQMASRYAAENRDQKPVVNRRADRTIPKPTSVDWAKNLFKKNGKEE